MRPVADGETRPSSFEVSAAGAGAPEGIDVHCYLKCSCIGKREELLQVADIDSLPIPLAAVCSRRRSRQAPLRQRHAEWRQLKLISHLAQIWAFATCAVSKILDRSCSLEGAAGFAHLEIDMDYR